MHLTKSPDKIQWHPAFCAAAEVELRSNMNELQLISEYNLSKQPIRIDLLIKNNIRKDTKLSNEFGHIMRRYNIIEYKSPGDSLTIDDFCKTLGYASLFKSTGKHVNEISIEEITMSLFCSSYPRELFEELKKNGYTLEEKYPGIYYVIGSIPIPVQIVIISRLEKEKHSALRILSNNTKEEDVERFLKETEQITEQADRANVDAILQASVSANFELYEEIRRSSNMCEALRRLMKDEIEEEIERKYNEGRYAGRQEGKKAGRCDGIIEGKAEAIKCIITNLSCTVEQAMDLLEIPLSQRALLIKRL